MKKIYLLLLLMGLFIACSSNNDEPVVPEEEEEEEEEQFVPKNPEAMTKSDCEKMIEQLYKNWIKEQSSAASKNITNAQVTAANTNMKFSVKLFGSEPSSGRSMWISLHGGGGTTSAVNDQQWANQKVLYSLTEGVYVCPRAPWDVWNMWFKSEIDPLFEELIKTMIVYYNVNPNKVYVMGYSAGGDGVWRLAPRMADHWAAAAMMAGHPGDISLLNVRNMPFTLWVGGEDTAYNRNVEVAKKGAELDSLQNLDPDGYIHETHVLEGYPHWMDQKDQAAVPWMEKYTRTPHPKRVVWRQEGVIRTAFYWLAVPKDECKQGTTVIAKIKTDNVIAIEQCDYSELTIYLADDMVDLDKDVTIQLPDGSVKTVSAKRSTTTLKETLSERYDKGYMFPVKVVLTGLV